MIGCTRLLLTLANLAYFVVLAALLAALEWHGEREWILGALLFFPATIWMLPSAAFGLSSLFFRSPLLFGANLLCILLVLWLYVGFQFSLQPEPRGTVVTIVTNNIGDGS